MSETEFKIKATEARVKNLSQRAAKGDRAAQRVLNQQLARLANLREEVAA